MSQFTFRQIGHQSPTQEELREEVWSPEVRHPFIADPRLYPISDDVLLRKLWKQALIMHFGFSIFYLVQSF